MSRAATPIRRRDVVGGNGSEVITSSPSRPTSASQLSKRRLLSLRANDKANKANQPSVTSAISTSPGPHLPMTRTSSCPSTFLRRTENFQRRYAPERKSETKAKTIDDTNDTNEAYRRTPPSDETSYVRGRQSLSSKAKNDHGTHPRKGAHCVRSSSSENTPLVGRHSLGPQANSPKAGNGSQEQRSNARTNGINETNQKVPPRNETNSVRSRSHDAIKHKTRYVRSHGVDTNPSTPKARKGSQDQRPTAKTKTTRDTSRRVPPSRGVYSVRSRSYDAKPDKKNHTRGQSLDTDINNAKTRCEGTQERRVLLELPENLKSTRLEPDGNLDEQTSASLDWGDDVSTAMSVLSMGTCGTNAVGSKSPVAGTPSGADMLEELRRKYGRVSVDSENDDNKYSKSEAPKKNAGRNESRGIKAKVNQRSQEKPSTIEDDTSTIATEATRQHSISYSRGNGSQTSKLMSRSKELDRLKRLSVGGLKPTSDAAKCHAEKGSLAAATNVKRRHYKTYSESIGLQASERSSSNNELDRLKRLSVGSLRPTSDAARGLETDSGRSNAVANTSNETRRNTRSRASTGSVTKASADSGSKYGRRKDYLEIIGKLKMHLTNDGASTDDTNVTSLPSISYSLSDDSQISPLASKESSRYPKMNAAGGPKTNFGQSYVATTDTSNETRRKMPHTGSSSKSGANACADSVPNNRVLTKKDYLKIVGRKREALTNDDASTVDTNTTSLPSISHSRSNDSQTSEFNSCASQESNSPQQLLSANDLKPKSHLSDKASVVTEGYEVIISSNESDESSEHSDKKPATLDRLKNVKKEEKSWDNYFKERRCGNTTRTSRSTKIERGARFGRSASSGRMEKRVEDSKQAVRTNSRSPRSASTGRSTSIERGVRFGRSASSGRMEEKVEESKQAIRTKSRIPHSASAGRMEKLVGSADKVNSSKITGRSNSGEIWTTEKERRQIHTVSAGYQQEKIGKEGNLARKVGTVGIEKKVDAANKTRSSRESGGTAVENEDRSVIGLGSSKQAARTRNSFSRSASTGRMGKVGCRTDKVNSSEITGRPNRNEIRTVENKTTEIRNANTEYQKEIGKEADVTCNVGTERSLYNTQASRKSRTTAIDDGDNSIRLSPVSRRNKFRGRSMSRSRSSTASSGNVGAESATNRSETLPSCKLKRNPSSADQSSASSATATLVKSGHLETEDEEKSMSPQTLASKRDLLRSRTLSRSRTSTTSIGGGDDDEKDAYTTPSRTKLNVMNSTTSAADEDFEFLTSVPSTASPLLKQLRLEARRNREETVSSLTTKTLQPDQPVSNEFPKKDLRNPSSGSNKGEGKKHNKDSAAGVEPGKKKATLPIVIHNEKNAAATMLAHVRERRSRSLTNRSRTQPPIRSCSSPKRTGGAKLAETLRRNTDAKNDDIRGPGMEFQIPPLPPKMKAAPLTSFMKPVNTSSIEHSSKPSPSLGAPPRMAVTTAQLKTPPRKTVTVENVNATSILPLAKSSPRNRQSPFLLPSSRSRSKVQKWEVLVAHSTVNFDVLKPSRLASFSVAVLCKAAIPIQCLARRCLAKFVAEERKKRILVVQSLTRRWLCVQRLKSAQLIALWCQGAYQGARVRNKVAFQYYCATRIQAAFRGFFAVLAFMGSLRKIILVQSIWRMKRHRKTHITWRLQKQTEIEVILTQSIVRRWIAKKSYRQRRETKAALMIQKNFRRHSAMLNVNVTVLDVIQCQAVVRRFLALKRIVTLRFNRYDKAALIIQTNFRRHSAEVSFIFQISDILLCQAVARQFLALKRVRHTRYIKAALIIQKSYRRHRAMVDFLYQVSDIILCQAVARRLLALKRVRAMSMRNGKAATIIQTSFRGYRAMVDFSFQVMDIILCQTTVRRFLAMKHTKQLRKRKCATKIQANWRRYLESNRIVLENKAASAIQTCFRGYYGFILFVVAKFSAVQIQACMRGHLAKCLLKKLRQEKIDQEAMALKNAAATVIQSCFRGYRDYTGFLVKSFSSIQIQSHVRCYQARCHLRRLNEEKQEEERMIYHLTKIQANWRRYLVFKRIVLENKAASAIQTCFRGYHGFILFVVAKFSAVQIQASTRSHLAKRLLKRLRQENTMALQNAAATVIQSCFRGYRDFTGFLVKSFSSIQIQSHVRCYQARCHLRRLNEEKQEKERMRRLKQENAAATIIQSSFRGYQHFVRYLMAQYFVMKIQTCVRGYQARCRLKRLERENRDKMIKKSQRLSDAMTRVSRFSSAFMKKNSTPAARDASFSSLYFSSNQKNHIFTKRELQERREKKAALVIERFFIKIRAEIELEIARLEQKERKKLMSKRKCAKKKRRTDSSFSRKGKLPSQHRRIN